MKKIILVLMVLSVFLAGCSSIAYEQGIAKITEINEKNSATMDSFPADKKIVESMISELTSLKGLKVDKQEQFDLALKYRILSLESGKFLLDAASFGSVGITGDGFSCKPKPIIVEASNFRIEGAKKGYEAVSVLKEFLDKYPDDAQKLGLSSKTAVFQNATAFQVEEQGIKDAKTIERFCPNERVLELYKEEFKSKNVMSEEDINSITYEDAAKKWREIRGR